ncbi:hypothetical protein STIAU_4203 [Stigmatella aurantiaca DW4/3-1]|uniref:Uncharacterized protein n=1 Tax=Stigmatella aurantiaca (strain DW4/3-1) TaxID=378806 RepID=Q08XE8_STIAD|nr:hypothetical protein STIAU_4203 [Stigmatella aurantiaca DW4/3-1]
MDAVKGIGQPRRMGQQVPHADGLRRGHGDGLGRGPSGVHARRGELGQPPADGIRQLEGPFLPQHHRRDGGDGLRHGVDAPEGVCLDLTARLLVGEAVRGQVGHLAAARDHHLPAREPPIVDVPFQVRVDTAQLLRVQAHVAWVHIDAEGRHGSSPQGGMACHPRDDGLEPGGLTMKREGFQPPRSCASGGAAHFGGPGNLDQTARLDVVDESVDGDALGHQGAGADALHVHHHALREILDREPVHELALGRAGTSADVLPLALVEHRRLEAALEQLAEGLLREELHAAVGMVDDEELLGAQQLVGDDEGADGIVTRTASGVADDVRIALLEPRELGGIDARVHAGQDGEASGGGQRQLALVTEPLGIGGVGGKNLIAKLAHR